MRNKTEMNKVFYFETALNMQENLPLKACVDVVNCKINDGIHVYLQIEKVKK